MPETLAIFDADTFNNGGVGLAQPLDTTGADNPHDDIMVVTAGEFNQSPALGEDIVIHPVNGGTDKLDDNVEVVPY